MSSTAPADSELQGDLYLTIDPTSEQYLVTEDIEWYEPGGFHPVHLGDLLGPDGRYRVVDKLGFGGWGTVWLCHDRIEGRWRAVKINAAAASHGEKDRELEAVRKLMERLRLGTVEGPLQILESHGIALPVNHFAIQGPNGTHLALVYPLLGASLGKVFQYNAPQPDLLKDICFQLVQAMQFLHRNGVCHGDFRPDNLLFRLADGVDQWSEKQILDVLGEPKTEQIMIASYTTLDFYPAPPNPSRPEYLVGQKYFDYTSGVLSTAVAVSDFGVSFLANNPPQDSAIPGHWAAPEEIVKGAASLGFASDVWALMNTIVHVRLEGVGMVGEEGARNALDRCELVIGPMRQNYRTAWKEMGGDFPNGSEDDLSIPAAADLARYPKFPNTWGGKDLLMFSLAAEHCTLLDQTLWEAIASQDYESTGLLPRLPYESKNFVLSDNVSYQLTDATELGRLYDLCMSVYKWQPGERASTAEILNHPWFGSRNDNGVQAAVASTKEINEGEETPQNNRTDKGTEISQRAIYQKPEVVAAEQVKDFAQEADHTEGVKEDGETNNDHDLIADGEFHGDQEVKRYGDDEVSYYSEGDDGIHYCHGDDDDHGVRWK